MDTKEDEECIINPPSNVQTLNGQNIHPSLAALLMKRTRILQRTKLWFTTRARMITCSDMASVLGENPYSSRKQVFKKKTGQSRPFNGNFATRRGQELEPIALAKYESMTGNVVWPEDVGLLQHDDYPQIGGSPDGITLNGILIEIKCPLTRKIIPGHCPGLYIAQVQILMEICNLETAHFVQYQPESFFCEEICDVTVVKRDRDYFSRALPVFIDFMEEVTEFYEQANLPIGTPMIDWSQEDAKAKERKEKKEAEKIGRVCAFVDNEFIIEDHTGDDVVRSVFPVDGHIDDYKECAVMKVVAEVPTVELDMEAILAQMPEKLQKTCREALKKVRDNDDDESDEVELDEVDPDRDVSQSFVAIPTRKKKAENVSFDFSYAKQMIKKQKTH